MLVAVLHKKWEQKEKSGNMGDHSFFRIIFRIVFSHQMVLIWQTPIPQDCSQKKTGVFFCSNLWRPFWQYSNTSSCTWKKQGKICLVIAAISSKNVSQNVFFEQRWSRCSCEKNLPSLFKKGQRVASTNLNKSLHESFFRSLYFLRTSLSLHKHVWRWSKAPA